MNHDSPATSRRAPLHRVLRASGARGIALLLALLLVACAGAPQPAAPTPTAAPPTPLPTVALRPTAPPLATLAPQPTPQPGALLLWTTEQGDALAVVRALAAEFADRAGFPITVIARSADGLRVSMLAVSVTGEPPPDLIWGDHEDLAGLLADGQIQALGPVAGAGGFVGATVAGASADGQLWGQPITANDPLLLLYNRALTPQPPATTDELIVQARAARQNDRYGLVMAWGEARWLLAWLNGFGGAPTTPDGMQPTLDTPQMISALNLLRELWAAAPPDQRGYADGSARFRAGAVAMTVDGDWSLAAYRSVEPPLDLGIAPLPRVPATGRLAAPALGGSYLMFQRSLDGPQLEQARLFANFLADPDTQVRLARDLQRLPALRSTLAAPAVANDPALAAAALQAEAALGLPPTLGLRCALRAINAQLPALIAGQQSQEQVATAMQQSAERCVTR